MNEVQINSEVARRFLLGECEDSERQQIEGRFVTDATIKETILLAEQELIDEYLDGELVGPQREKFVRQYQATPLLRRKLRIAEALKRHGRSQAWPAQSPSVWDRCRKLLSSGWLGRRPIFIPAAVALILLIILTSVWLVRRYDYGLQRNQQLAITQELAELNSPANLQTMPPQMLSLVLSPVTVRSADMTTPSAPASSKQVVELQLLWTGPENNQELQATIGRLGAAEKLTISNLRVETISGRKIVRIRLPGHLVMRGLYQIFLSGSPANRNSATDEEYIFKAD